MNLKESKRIGSIICLTGLAFVMLNGGACGIGGVNGQNGTDDGSTANLVLSDGVTRYDYDSAGRLRQVARDQTTTHTFINDSAGNITEIAVDQTQ